MWGLTIVWMLCLAGGLQDLRGAPTVPIGTDLFWWGILLLWPLYVLELTAHTLLRSPNYRFNVLYAIAPPLRLGGRDHRTWTRVWLPWAGWRHVDRKLVAQVERALNPAMVGFALLVLPLLVVELWWKETIGERTALHFAVETASSVIWLAFAMELVVMVSIARRKTRYLAEHWIDLLIVLLPMVQVLPALRLAAVGRLASFGRIKHLSALYRTRGLAMRAFRGFLVLDSVQRLLQLNPEKRLAALREKLEDYQHEIEQIRSEMRELEARIAAEERADAAADAAGVECEVAAGE
jgi:hypothetical protein